jgi:competence protein ComGC
MAAVSLTFALVTVLNSALWAALPFAVAWGLAIMMLDRLFVVSLSRHQNPVVYWTLAAWRLFLAMIIGLVISTPFILVIFRPEIEQQVQVIQDRAAAAYYRQLPHDPLSRNVAREEKAISKLQAEIALNAPGANLKSNKTLKGLNQQLQVTRAAANAAYDEWQCQLYGTSPTGQHCPAGDGTLAQHDESKYKKAESRVNAINAQISRETNYLIKHGRRQQELQAKLAKARLGPAEKLLAADQKLQATQTRDFDRANSADKGLLIRLKALGEVTAGNFTLTMARILLFLLFVLIDCMPVIAKIMLNLSPENSYEEALAAEERKQLRVAEHQRAIDQAAEFKAAQTRVADSRNRLAGFTADIPELTDDVIAARKEVEAAWLRAWKETQLRRIARGENISPSENGVGPRDVRAVQPPRPSAIERGRKVVGAGLTAARARVAAVRARAAAARAQAQQQARAQQQTQARRRRAEPGRQRDGQRRRDGEQRPEAGQQPADDGQQRDGQRQEWQQPAEPGEGIGFSPPFPPPDMAGASDQTEG